MKYKIKPVEIEAEQLILEVPHPLLGSVREINVPQCVSKHVGCGIRQCHICGGSEPTSTIYYIDKGYGNLSYLQNKDWVIAQKDGSFSRCDESTFKEFYEKVE